MLALSHCGQLDGALLIMGTAAPGVGCSFCGGVPREALPQAFLKSA